MNCPKLGIKMADFPTKTDNIQVSFSVQNENVKYSYYCGFTLRRAPEESPTWDVFKIVFAVWLLPDKKTG